MPSPETPADPTPPDLAPPDERPAGARPPEGDAGESAEAPPAAERDADPVEAEPSLRAYLADRWAAAPPLVTWGGLVLLVGLVAWAVSGRGPEVVEGPDDEDWLQRAAMARAEWAAMRRLAPDPIGEAPVTDDLGPGDAERSDDRFADYYAYEADSTAFSVLVTSADFAPDLAVRSPDGHTVAASNLLRTATRAEIGGFEGPGRFEVVVTSREPGATGRYDVAIVPAGPIDSVYVDEPARLDTLGGGPLRAGRHERLYGIAAGSEAPVLVRVVAQGFVPRLHLLGPNGEVRDGWRTLERSSSGDDLHGALLRYLPGWDAPYRLIVSSEEPGATGPFALDVRSIRIRDLQPDGRGFQGTLGDESWLVDGRYVDTYRFRVRAGETTTLTARSDAFPPAARLWTIEGRSRKEVAAELNAAQAASVSMERELAGGEYYLEVTSGGGEDDLMLGGPYSVTVRSEPLIPPAPDSTRQRFSGPVPESRVFSTEVRRTGQSGGSTFEVGVTHVAISHPGGTQTRVQLSVTVRSVDYTGNWAPWESFAAKAYVVDDAGKRYRASVAESTSPSGPTAEPGTARRGIVVFYAPGVTRNLKRVVLVASIGDRTLTLPIPVP